MDRQVGENSTNRTLRYWMTLLMSWIRASGRRLRSSYWMTSRQERKSWASSTTFRRMQGRSKTALTTWTTWTGGPVAPPNYRNPPRSRTVQACSFSQRRLLYYWIARRARYPYWRTIQAWIRRSRRCLNAARTLTQWSRTLQLPQSQIKETCSTRRLWRHPLLWTMEATLSC